MTRIRILSMLAALSLAATPFTALLHAQQPAACCAVTSIDARSGVVTARAEATGQTFEFRVADRRAVRTIRVRQSVWADFSAMKAGLVPTDLPWSIQALSSPVSATGRTGLPGLDGLPPWAPGPYDPTQPDIRVIRNSLGEPQGLEMTSSGIKMDLDFNVDVMKLLPGLRYAACFAAAAAGWLNGGGSLSDMPIGEIAEECRKEAGLTP